MRYDWKVGFVWILLLCGVLSLFGCTGDGRTEEMTNQAEAQIDDTLYCITWYTQVYNDQKDAISIPFDVVALQQDVANMDVEFPLNTNERIADYALQLGEVLKAHGYLQPEMRLSEAFYYVSDIWEVVYTPEAGSALQRGSYWVTVSGTDGHIIDIALWGE